MRAWYDKLIARRMRGWETGEGQDSSMDRILPELQKLQGSVLEIGPGLGNLLQHLPPGVSYTALEPNVYLHEVIHTQVGSLGMKKAQMSVATAELMPFPDEAFDAVVSVRSLCSMQDVALVLQQIRRVLKPGGKFIFTEHVAAPRGSFRRLLQQVVRYPHQIIAGGCDPSRDIGEQIEAAGFASVKIEHFSKPERLFSAPRIAGVAVKVSGTPQ